MRYWLRFLARGRHFSRDRVPPRDGEGEGEGEGKKKKTEEGDGGGGDGDPPEVPTVVLPPDVLETLRRGAEKHGGQSEFTAILYNENKLLRDKLREATNAPKGSVVLTEKADVEAYGQLKERGSLAQVLTSLKELDKLKKDQAEQEKLGEMRKAFEAQGFNFDVGKQIAGASELDYQIVTAKDGEGNEIRNVFVVTEKKEEDGKIVRSTTPLNEYAEENWKGFLPILQAGQNGDDQEEQGGTRMPRTGPTQGDNATRRTQTKAGKKGYGTSYVKQQYGSQDKGEKKQ